MIKNFVKTPFFYVLLIFVFSIPVFVGLIHSGNYPVHDDFQIIRTLQIDKCFKDGQFPCRWVPDMGFGYGYPQFNYYAPLPYYFMELLYLAGISLIDSVKIFVVLITLVSAYSMYAFSKYLWKSNLAGIISSVLYIFLPFRAVDMYVRGAVAELAAMAVIPLLFLFSLKIQEGKKRSVLWFGICTAVLFLSHNISSLIILPFIFLWILFLIIRSKNLKVIPDVLFGFFIGLGLSAFFVIPAWFEKDYVHIGTLTSGYFNYLAHFVSLKQMLIDNHWGYGSSQLGIGDDISLTVGIGQWIMASISLLLVFVFRKFRYLATTSFFFILGWVALFMMHEKSSFIWKSIPILAYVQFPWRFLIVGGFGFSVTAGVLGTLKNKLLKYGIVAVGLLATVFIYMGYFQPKEWLDVSDKEKLSGQEWTKAITASLYDYLPVSAKKAPDFEASVQPVINVGKADIISGEKGTDWQSWKVKVLSDSAVVELQIYYFPNWRVSVDGKQSEFNYDNNHGLINVTLNKGEHNVNAYLENTFIRKIANSISIIFLLIVVLAFIKRK